MAQLGDMLDDLLARDGIGKGSADMKVIERKFRGVEGEEPRIGDREILERFLFLRILVDAGRDEREGSSD